MRIFLLPISTRRTLLYCERLPQKTSSGKQSWSDWLNNKATTTWASWEKAPRGGIQGWKNWVTRNGNQALKRIPYEEWGLKTVPPLTKKRRQRIEEGKVDVDVLFPAAFLKESRTLAELKQLATERQGLHSKRLMWSFVLMPLTAPFALLPVVPNLPFFYVAYRAWSHYRALYGAKHIELLLEHNIPKLAPSYQLDELYTAGLVGPSREQTRHAPRPNKQQIEEIAALVERQTNGGTEDVMVLQRWNGKLIAESFTLPEMEVEVERAVEQVEKSIKAAEELREEKEELERSIQMSGGASPAPNFPSQVSNSSSPNTSSLSPSSSGSHPSSSPPSSPLSASSSESSQSSLSSSSKINEKT